MHSIVRAALAAALVAAVAPPVGAAPLDRSTVVLPSAISVDLTANTVTLPLYRGTAHGAPVWYIKTKGMLHDHARSRIYVSVRDKSEVVVIDTKQRAIVATYTSPDLKTNVPIGEDAQQRLFVGGRKPNELVILNSRTGATLQYLPTVAESDDLTVDAAHRRIYVTGSTGLAVYAEGTGGHYSREAHYDPGGGKTSIYVPSLQRFYVARSRTDAPQSALLIYRVQPPISRNSSGREDRSALSPVDTSVYDRAR